MARLVRHRAPDGAVRRRVSRGHRPGPGRSWSATLTPQTPDPAAAPAGRCVPVEPLAQGMLTAGMASASRTSRYEPGSSPALDPERGRHLRAGLADRRRVELQHLVGYALALGGDVLVELMQAMAEDRRAGGVGERAGAPCSPARSAHCRGRSPAPCRPPPSRRGLSIPVVGVAVDEQQPGRSPPWRAPAIAPINASSRRPAPAADRRARSPGDGSHGKGAFTSASKAMIPERASRAGGRSGSATSPRSRRREPRPGRLHRRRRPLLPLPVAAESNGAPIATQPRRPRSASRDLPDQAAADRQRVADQRAEPAGEAERVARDPELAQHRVGVEIDPLADEAFSSKAKIARIGSSAAAGRRQPPRRPRWVPRTTASTSTASSAWWSASSSLRWSEGCARIGEVAHHLLGAVVDLARRDQLVAQVPKVASVSSNSWRFSESMYRGRAPRASPSTSGSWPGTSG